MRKSLYLCLAVVAACGKGEVQHDATGAARKALAEGSPRRAIGFVREATSGPELVLRLRAQIAIDEWGSAEGLLAKLPDGADKRGVMCLLEAARTDIGGYLRCEEARKLSYEDPVLGDEVAVALAKSYETEHRPGEAEKVLRALVGERPTAPNRRALVDFFDRQGFVKDAVEALEVWFAQSPDDPTLRARLGQLLERKVRGDLLDKRWADAEAAARRCLALIPQKGEVRYYLADALAGQGKANEAEAERATAKSAGVKAPPPVDSFPGMGNAPVPDQPPGDTLPRVAP